MKEFSLCARVEYENGFSENVIYIVLELAPNGELFDYIAIGSHALPERVCRFYFK
jgi:hypothetical protein